MVEIVDLKEIEKKAWRATYQDGLWDIYIGLLITGFAFLFLLNTFGIEEPLLFFFLICWNTIPILILFFGKKFITPKRIGSVKFGKKRKKTKKRLTYFLTANLFILLIFLILTPMGVFELIPLEGLMVPLFLGLFISIPLFIVAYFLDFSRLYVYSIFFGLGLLLSDLLFPLVGTPFDFLLSFGLPGIMITLIGVYFLISFIKKYPKE
jgi:hypothetical protein